MFDISVNRTIGFISKYSKSTVTLLLLLLKMILNIIPTVFSDITALNVCQNNSLSKHSSTNEIRTKDEKGKNISVNICNKKLHLEVNEILNTSISSNSEYDLNEEQNLTESEYEREDSA